MNALERLETTLASLRKDVPTVRVGGIVSEVAATHYRVSGLSRYVKLGELIGLEIDNQVQLGEVVRIDSDGVTAKPFDSHIGAGPRPCRVPPAAEDDRAASGLERPRAQRAGGAAR
jgi:flagellum-specific ATP synthase